MIITLPPTEVLVTDLVASPGERLELVARNLVDLQDVVTVGPENVSHDDQREAAARLMGVGVVRVGQQRRIPLRVVQREQAGPAIQRHRDLGERRAAGDVLEDFAEPVGLAAKEGEDAVVDAGDGLVLSVRPAIEVLPKPVVAPGGVVADSADELGDLAGLGERDKPAAVDAAVNRGLLEVAGDPERLDRLDGCDRTIRRDAFLDPQLQQGQVALVGPGEHIAVGPIQPRNAAVDKRLERRAVDAANDLPVIGQHDEMVADRGHVGHVFEQLGRDIEVADALGVDVVEGDFVQVAVLGDEHRLADDRSAVADAGDLAADQSARLAGESVRVIPALQVVVAEEQTVLLVVQHAGAVEAGPHRFAEGAVVGHGEQFAGVGQVLDLAEGDRRVGQSVADDPASVVRPVVAEQLALLGENVDAWKGAVVVQDAAGVRHRVVRQLVRRRVDADVAVLVVVGVGVEADDRGVALLGQEEQRLGQVEADDRVGQLVGGPSAVEIAAEHVAIGGRDVNDVERLVEGDDVAADRLRLGQRPRPRTAVEGVQAGSVRAGQPELVEAVDAGLGQLDDLVEATVPGGDGQLERVGQPARIGRGHGDVEVADPVDRVGRPGIADDEGRAFDIRVKRSLEAIRVDLDGVGEGLALGVDGGERNVDPAAGPNGVVGERRTDRRGVVDEVDIDLGLGEQAGRVGHADVERGGAGEDLRHVEQHAVSAGLLLHREHLDAVGLAGDRDRRDVVVGVDRLEEDLGDAVDDVGPLHEQGVAVDQFGERVAVHQLCDQQVARFARRAGVVAPDDVLAEFAVQFVVAALAEELVVAVASQDEIVAFAAERDVVALVGGDDVVALVAVDQVIAAAAGDDVDAALAFEVIVALIAMDAVVVVAAEDGVVALGAADGVVAVESEDAVASGAAVDDVVAVFAVDPVVAVAGVDAIVADAAEDDVVAGAAVEGVVAAMAVKPVVAVAADEVVVRGVAVELVIALLAVQAVGLVGGVAGAAAEELVVAKAAGEEVEAVQAEEAVVAEAAVDDVVAVLAVDPVVAVAGGDAVVAVAAEDDVVAVAAVDRVVAGVAFQGVVAVAAAEVVVAVAAFDQVIAVLAEELVVAAEAVELVVAVAAVHGVQAGAAVEDVVGGSAVKPVDAGVADEDIAVAAALDDVVAVAGVEAVEAGFAVDAVVADVAVDVIVAGAAEEVVVAAAAADLVVAAAAEKAVAAAAAEDNVVAAAAGALAE